MVWYFIEHGDKFIFTFNITQIFCLSLSSFGWLLLRTLKGSGRRDHALKICWIAVISPDMESSLEYIE